MSARDEPPIKQTKLLTPDPEHLKAVAQSPLGRMLGFARGYTLAIVAYLAGALLLDQSITYIFEPSWPARSVRLTLICVTLAVPAIWLYYAQRPRLRPKLFVQIELAKPGYFRIGPYEDLDRDRRSFHRADAEHERVRDWLLRQPGAPLYLTGDSGTGKSSLLQAFVLPALAEAGWTTIVARPLHDPESTLRRALGATQRDPTELRVLLARAARKAKNGLLVTLDQFEEFLIHQNGSHTGASPLTSLLEQLANDPVPGLRLLLVLRSDYQTLIERLGFPPMRHGENWRQVGRFGMADARSFVGASGLSLTEKELKRLLASAADLDDTPGLVRPVTLNMLGFILATGRAVWREHTTADKIIRGYIRDTVQHPAIRSHASALLRHLVTELGTKRPRTLVELAAISGLDLAQARIVLLNLQAAGLVRALGEVQEMWEVSHDFVARLLERELEPRRRNWWPKRRRPEPHAAQRSAEAQARAALSDLGIFIRETSQGLELTTAPDVSDAELRRTKPFLRFFASRIVRASFAGYPKHARHLPFLTPVATSEITDLIPLSVLSALESLDLSATRSTDLSPLSTLAALKSLDLAFTQVSDLTPLCRLTGLRTLNLSGTEVSDFSPLSALTMLELLDLSGTKLADLAPLIPLTALASLALSNTNITSLMQLSALRGLQRLDVSSTKVIDADPLSVLTALRSLNLAHTALTELAPLSSLAGLQSLDLSFTQVANLAPLSGLVELQSLILSDTRVADLGPLSQLTRIVQLSFHRARKIDLAPLANLIFLRSLDLFQSSVTDLRPLSKLVRLKSLGLFGTRITDIGPLSGLPELNSLSLSQTQVSDLKPLSDLVSLRTLDLAFTPVVDLKPLSNIKTLESLDLGHSKAQDLTPLQDLPLLRYLRPPDISADELRRFRQFRATSGLPDPLR